jgi:hypothetical protein
MMSVSLEWAPSIALLSPYTPSMTADWEGPHSWLPSPTAQRLESSVVGRSLVGRCRRLVSWSVGVVDVSVVDVSPPCKTATPAYLQPTVGGSKAGTPGASFEVVVCPPRPCFLHLRSGIPITNESRIAGFVVDGT